MYKDIIFYNYPPPTHTHNKESTSSTISLEKIKLKLSNSNACPSYLKVGAGPGAGCIGRCSGLLELWTNCIGGWVGARNAEAAPWCAKAKVESVGSSRISGRQSDLKCFSK
jgi:hypothetical protein